MGYEQFQAKKTWYAGTWYDSNLEARVAEALDKLGHVYEYHRQCFRDAGFVGGQYTPDFHLPNNDVYIEVTWSVDDKHSAKVSTFARIFNSGRLDAPRIITVDGSGDTVEWRVSGTEVKQYNWYWKLGNPQWRNIFDVAGMKRW